jgi:hypothetical protein
MRRARVIFSTAVVLAAIGSASQAQAQADGGIEAMVRAPTSEIFILRFNESSVPFVPAESYGYVGYRVGQMSFGLGLGLHQYSLTVTPPMGTDQTLSGLALQLAPTAMIPIGEVMEHGQIYVTVALPISIASTSSPDRMGGTRDASIFGFGLSAGVGGRHFFSPNFAVGAELGLWGQMLSVSASATSMGMTVDDPNDTGALNFGMFGALTATFIIGGQAPASSGSTAAASPAPAPAPVLAPAPSPEPAPAVY